ncbi:slipin family protein [Aminipila terrae]|uniref:Slipin family protein n=1 Tax=Aminipila terrae TaxID=2697030 RepID=A0A6P1MIS2_9FIRM|nr:slipin family protein [Aminipila terrae]QHI73093.1 slipin family protein [Aminipila terrae]
MKMIINENQRGLLFKDGKFLKMLVPGKYTFFNKQKKVVVVNTSEEFKLTGYDLSIFLKNEELAKQLAVVDVKDETLVLHYINGKFSDCLQSGKYAYWTIFDQHEFKEIDIKNPEVDESISKFIFTFIPRKYFFKIEVAQYQKARLYFDQKYVKLLDEGTYYFWNNGTKIEVGFADTRLMQMDIAGQEILTLDKVALRINFVCHYKIMDYVKIYTEIEDFEQQMHVTLQLALREYIGKYRLDEILENKEQISKLAYQKLKEKEGDYFIKVVDAGVKDVILPGEIRDIMNTVLIAEKKAQANVITRREEVASTRSLLNTAKLMEENQTLYKLKELEYLEKICENVGSISVSGGTDLLSQLTKILRGA